MSTSTRRIFMRPLEQDSDPMETAVKARNAVARALGAQAGNVTDSVEADGRIVVVFDLPDGIDEGYLRKRIESEAGFWLRVE